MNNFQKGLLFAAIQVALVSSLGAKLLWDRAREPRGWALTRGYDPDLIIRGRYVSVSLLVKADKVYSSSDVPQAPSAARPFISNNVTLKVENGRIGAIPADHYTGFTLSGPEMRDGEMLAQLYPPVVYFLPEHAANPLQGRGAGTLVLEATIPQKGPPRPIRFGTKVGDQIAPLPPD